MKSKFLVKGLIKCIPGIEKVHNFHKRTGGTNNARYCYSVWLRHLVYAFQNGQVSMPGKIVELGPGDSLGIGLSALISGAEQYFVFDVVKYFTTEINVNVFDELVDLFKNKTPIPDDKEFPCVKPILDNYDFPKKIFTDDYLRKVLDKDRLERIRNAIKTLEDSDSIESMINYNSNWASSEIKNESINMVISQAVLEYVDDLSSVYKIMHKWLTPNSLISNTIDFREHGMADNWYGHWTYSDLEWKIIKGRKKYLINREPYSTHIQLLNDNNFKIICDLKTKASIEVKNADLAKRFKNLTEDDLTTETVFIQARK